MIGSGIRTGITTTTHPPDHVLPSFLPSSSPSGKACLRASACLRPLKILPMLVRYGRCLLSSSTFFHSFNLRSPSSSLSSFLPSVKSPWGKICCLRILIGLFSRRVVSSIAFGICSKFAHLSETQSIRPLTSLDQLLPPPVLPFVRSSLAVRSIAHHDTSSTFFVPLIFYKLRT